VSLITVTPTSAFPGDQVVANISLTSPVPAGTTVELSWATQNNPTQTILTVASVPSGATVTSINFFAPSAFGGGGGGGGGGPSGGMILIFARTANSAQYASASLQVQRP
jgi:hypothetical protein